MNIIPRITWQGRNWETYKPREYLPGLQSEDEDVDVISFNPISRRPTEKRRILVVFGKRIPLGSWKAVWTPPAPRRHTSCGVIADPEATEHDRRL